MQYAQEIVFFGDSIPWTCKECTCQTLLLCIVRTTSNICKKWFRAVLRHYILGIEGRLISSESSTMLTWRWKKQDTTFYLASHYQSGGGSMRRLNRYFISNPCYIFRFPVSGSICLLWIFLYWNKLKALLKAWALLSFPSFFISLFALMNLIYRQFV